MINVEADEQRPAKKLTDRQKRWRVSTFPCLEAKEEIREYERSTHRKKVQGMREMRKGQEES